MIGKLLTGPVGAYIRIGAGLALAAGLAWTHWQAYDAGVASMQAEKDKAERDALEQRLKDLQKLTAANERIRTIESQSAKAIAAAQARGTAQAQIVERVIRENPDFAAVARPDDLQRVRDDALADIEAAANRSAELSGLIVPSVRGAD